MQLVLLALALMCLAASPAGASTCDLLRAVPVPAGALILNGSSQSLTLGSGNTLTAPLGVYVLGGAVLSIIRNGSGEAAIAGPIVLDGGTLYVAPNASFNWAQSYSNQYSMTLVRGAVLGYDMNSTVRHGSSAHVIGPMLVCDTSAVSFNGANLGSAVPAPFLYERSSLTVNGGTGGLTEVSLSDNATASLFAVTALGVNVYFYVATNVSGTPIVPPAGTASTPSTGSFAIGGASVAYSASMLYLGGFWMLPGARAVFSDAPALALFLSLASSTAVSGLRPQSYPGTSAAAPSCIDSACGIAIGFVRSTTIILNLYVSGAGTVLTLANSTIGELSVDAGVTVLASASIVDGSGGFITVAGTLHFAGGHISCTLTLNGAAIANFTNSALALRPPAPSPAPLYITASSTAVLILSNTTVAPAYALSLTGSARAVSVLPVSGAVCEPSAVLALQDFAVARAWGAAATVALTVSVSWGAGGLPPPPLALSSTSGGAAAGSVTCPAAEGQFTPTVTAVAAPAAVGAVATSAVEVSKNPPPFNFFAPPPPPPVAVAAMPRKKSQLTGTLLFFAVVLFICFCLAVSGYVCWRQNRASKRLRQSRALVEEGAGTKHVDLMAI